LTERRLLLSEMTLGVDLEGSQMSSVPLPADDLHRRVADTVGRLDAGALTQLPMRPERGCRSLVSVRSIFLLVSDCPWFSQPRLFVRLQEVGFHKPSLPPVPEDAVDLGLLMAKHPTHSHSYPNLITLISIPHPPKNIRRKLNPTHPITLLTPNQPVIGWKPMENPWA
jgi:hypothetical protein